MKTCSLSYFLEELAPWLSSRYIHRAVADGKGHFALHFLDGTKNIYIIDDCNEQQIEHLITDLEKEGIRVEH